MFLITIIDKKIYYEYQFFGGRGTKSYPLAAAHLSWLYDSLMKLVPHKDFPSKVQFWYRAGYDRFDFVEKEGIELDYP